MQKNGGSSLVDPEVAELLSAIARTSIDPLGLGALAERVKDWNAVIERSRQHRISPMCYLRLERAGSHVPSGVLEQLRLDYERNAVHNLANAAELISILKMFEGDSIPAIPFKGVVLAASAYGNMMARHGGDLDLLVRWSDVTKATALLVATGYILRSSIKQDGAPTYPYCYEYNFFRPADGIVVELRWRLDGMYPRLGRDLGLDWVWPSRRAAMLAGAEVPSLSPEIALLFLCDHGIKHTWSQMVWISDIAHLLASSPDLDWETAIREARSVGLWRSLAFGVLLAYEVADAPVPRPILNRLQSSSAARRIADHFAKSVFEAPGRGPGGHLPYRVQLLDFHDRIRMLCSLEFLRPNERDRAAVPLPEWLDPLYYLIRPLRLLMDRSPRN